MTGLHLILLPLALAFPGDPPANVLEDLPLRLSLGAVISAKPGQEPLQEQPPQEPLTPQELPEEEGPPFIDWDWLELNPRLGLAIFSEDFETDPSFAVSARFRAPMPWLSPASDPGGDYFGLFADVALTRIDRDIEPTLDDPDGLVFFLTIGMDYTFVRSDTWILMAQAGALYGHFGGIDDLNDGVGPMVGLTAGFRVAAWLSVSYSPEVVFGPAGDNIFLNYIGVMIGL